MKIWTDKKERWILFFVIFWLLLLCIVESNQPLPRFFANTFIETALTYDVVKSIIRALASGIVSAYLFYIVIDLWPRKRREESIYHVLDSLVTSVIVEESRVDIFGHERSVMHVDIKRLLALKEHLDKKQQWRRQVDLRLQCAMHAAQSKLNAFRDALPLAVELSPKHALYWMSLTEKIKLLAEVYDDTQAGTFDETKFQEMPERSGFYTTLCLRYQEVVEESIDWMDLRKSCNTSFSK